MELSKIDVLRRSVERIKQALRDKNAGTKTACVAALKWCDENDHVSDEETAVCETIDANTIVQPFVTACESRDDAVVCLGLDGLEQCLSHGVFDLRTVYDAAPSSRDRGRSMFGADAKSDAPMKNDLKGKPLADALTIVVCNTHCGHGSEELLVQVVRTLLTCVATTQIHGEHLLLAIRTTVNVSLLTTSMPLQATGRTCISQMVGLLQRRLEVQEGQSDAWNDVSAVFDFFVELIEPTRDIATMSMGMTLLYNFVVNFDEALLLQDEGFANRMKRQLMPAILPHIVGNSTTLCKASSHMFQHLLQNCRHALSGELAVVLTFIGEVIDRATAFAHSSHALSTCLAVAQNPQVLCDMFVNFDAAVGMPSAFGAFCVKLGRVVMAKHTTLSPQQQESLKVLTMSALTAIVSSLTTFHDTHKDCPDDGTLEQFRSKAVAERVTASFNKSPKKGIALALEVGLLANESVGAVAQFLRTRGFQKVKVGEYMGGTSPFVLDVMKTFVDLNDFTGLLIDEAMRVLLGKFKIQGEAAIVDRTMEKFASRYCDQNPDAFAEQDTAYVLAFSIMMLNTDAHSVNVKTKMTGIQFLSQNRGIDNGNNLPDELLNGIYTRITEREIKLDDDEPLQDVVDRAATKETPVGWNVEPLMTRTIARLTDVAVMPDFIEASDPVVAGLMWDQCWTGILATLSVPLEGMLSARVVDKCLEGFSACVHLSCLTSRATARRAFVAALSNFTKLSSNTDLDIKHVKAIRMLLRVAMTNSDAMGESWADVFMCVSRLQKLQNHVRENKLTATKTELHNAEMIQAGIEPSKIDAIFSCASDLSAHALSDFVTALCSTSRKELAEGSVRHYSLAMLVDVVSLQIPRDGEVWKTLWPIVIDHFSQEAVHGARTSAVVIDYLKKFVTNVFSSVAFGEVWQVNALRPFVNILSHCGTSAVRQQAITGLLEIATAFHDRLSSACHVLIAAASRVAMDPTRGVVAPAFKLLLLTATKIDCFSTENFANFGHACSMFAGNVIDKLVAGRAIALLEKWAMLLAVGMPINGDGVVLITEALQPSDDGTPSSFAVLLSSSGCEHRSVVEPASKLKVWLGMLASFSALVTAPFWDVREVALAALFRTVNSLEDTFTSPDDWRVIISAVISPVFAHMLGAITGDEVDDENYVDLLRQGTTQLTALFTDVPSRLDCHSQHLFAPVFRCTGHAHSVVSDVGFSMLRTWASSTALSTAHNEGFAAQIVSALESSGPATLATVDGAGRVLQYVEVIDIAVASRGPIVVLGGLALLRALRSVFEHCTIVKASSSKMVALERRVCATVCQVLAVLDNFDELAAWATVIISSYLSHTDTHQRSHGATAVEAETAALADAVFQLLSSVMTSADDAMYRFFETMHSAMCDLVRCCDPRICGCLSVLFRKFHDIQTNRAVSGK
jgi:hypothetical protein